MAEETSSSKSSDRIDEAEEQQEGSSSNLDPNSIPLRVIYSPSVSRSASIGHSDRPSIVISHEDDLDNDVQVQSPDDDTAQVQSFQAASFSDSRIHRRSRTNSNVSHIEGRGSASNPPSPIVQRSSSPTGRLAFEESGRRDHLHAPSVFVAFAETKWFRPMFAAKTILGFVICAVLGNLIYT